MIPLVGASELNEAERRFQAAYAAYQAGHFKDAAAQFDAWRRDFPAHFFADYAELHAADSLLRSGRYEAAEAILRSYPQRFPTSRLLPDAAFLDADAYFAQQDYATARQRYAALRSKKTLRSHPRMTEAALRLGECHERAGDFEAALALYHAERLRQVGTIWYGRFKAQEERIAPNHPAAGSFYTTARVLKAAETLINSGRAGDALLLLDLLQSRALTPALRFQADMKRAAALYALRDNARAKASYARLLRDNPTSKSAPDILERLARLHLRDGDMAGFEPVYARLLKDFPASPSAASVAYLKGKELELQGQLQAALKEFDAFLAAHPKNALRSEALWHVGWCRYQLRQYQAALTAFDQMARQYRKSYLRQEALFWAARSAEHLRDDAKAAAYYRETLNAGSRDYFGRLSQHALSRLTRENPALTAPGASPIRPLNWANSATFTTRQGREHQQKAVAFARIGLHALAADELAFAVQRDAKRPAQYAELARFYARAGNYHAQFHVMHTQFSYWILFGGKDVPPEFWQLAYPRGFAEAVETHGAANKVDSSVIQAIMLAESALDPAVISPAGAVGLMQLMPDTGRRVAQAFGIEPPSFEQYVQPDVNIRLGAAYLQQLSRLFQGKLPPIIASYNAGEHRVKTWWQAAYAQDIPAFIAMIPYKETRMYVRKVLWYVLEYQESSQQPRVLYSQSQSCGERSQTP